MYNIYKEEIFYTIFAFFFYFVLIFTDSVGYSYLMQQNKYLGIKIAVLISGLLCLYWLLGLIPYHVFSYKITNSSQTWNSVLQDWNKNITFFSNNESLSSSNEFFNSTNTTKSCFKVSSTLNITKSMASSLPKNFVFASHLKIKGFNFFI